MSSQNYLSNVFRQVYTYSNGQFVPSINLSNISKITADSLTVTTLSLGGMNDNLYFGDGAGSLDSNSSNNTAVGVEAAGSASNVNNSVFLGRSAGLGASGTESTIGIGVSANGFGTSNVYIGNGTGAGGASSTSNIFIGHSLDTASSVSNQLRIGQDGNVLLAGDFSNKWLGVGTLTPTSGFKLDVSGGAYIAGNVTIGAGGNLIVAGDISAGSIRTTAISGPSTRMEAGTVSKPSYAFLSDTSLGFYDASGHSLGFANQGIQVMCISGTRVGINTPAPTTTLDVNGDISANTYNGPDGTAAAPKYTFSSDRSTGIFLDSGKLSFTVGGVKQMEVTSNGIVNTNTNAIAINKVLRDATVPVDYDISSGNINVSKTVSASNFTGTSSASNQIGGVTLSNNNISNSGQLTSSNIRVGNAVDTNVYAVEEFGKGADPTGTGGTPAVAFQYATGGFRHFIRSRHSGANDVCNAIEFFTNTSGSSNSSTAPGAGGNALAMSVASGGVGIGMQNPTVALDVSGGIKSTAAGSNSIGGVTLSNNNIGLSGTITGSTANTSNQIGGVILSNNNISNSGQLTSSNIRVGSAPSTTITATEEFGGGYDGNGSGVGGIASPAMAFQYRIAPGGYRHFIRTRHNAAVSDSGNAIDFFTNNSASDTGSTTPGTSNALAMSITSAGVGVGLTVPTVALDVSGAAKASSTITGSNFTTPTASSNSVGGVVLSNNNVSNSGQLTSSNIRVGNAVDTNVYAIEEFGKGTDPAGTIVGGTPAMAFQYIAGGFRHFLRSRHSGTDDVCNAIEFFTNIANASNSSTAPGTGNVLAMSVASRGVGIGMSNPTFNLDVSGNIRSTAASSNNIGGITLSNSNVSGVVTTTTSNILLNGYLRNALTPSQFDISSGNISVTDGVIRVRNSATGVIGSAYSNGFTFQATNEVPQDRGTIAKIVPTLDSTDNVFGISFQTNTNTATGITEKMRVTGSGRVGIATTAPAYPLDVSTASNAASINMSAWPRLNTTSNFFWVRGHCNANLLTYRVRWNTTNYNTPNSSIMTWTDDATNGTYFTILKSGIWSIQCGVACSTTGYMWIDASTGFAGGYANPGTAGTGDMIALGSGGTANFYPLSFTGFLPSNSGRYYRFSSTNQTNDTSAKARTYVTIALLYETPEASGSASTFFTA